MRERAHRLSREIGSDVVVELLRMEEDRTWRIVRVRRLGPRSVSGQPFTEVTELWVVQDHEDWRSFRTPDEAVELVERMLADGRLPPRAASGAG